MWISAARTSPASSSQKFSNRRSIPNADRLSVCSVDAGNSDVRQIVCGAKNYRVGDKVPLALPGAVLPGDFKINVGKLRGVESQGMMCSAKELGLGEGHEGLLILPADAPIGHPLRNFFPPTPSSNSRSRRTVPIFSPITASRARSRRCAASRLQPPPFQHLSPIFAHQRAASRIQCAGSLCPFYSARRIRGVSVGPSPDVAAHTAGVDRHSLDQQHRRCHQLRDDGNGPAASRV